MTLDPTAVSIAVVSLLGVIVSTLQARSANRRATDLERRRVDIEGNEDHWRRTDAIIQRLTDEIERLDRTLAATREALEIGQQENAVLRARIAKAEVHIARLRTIVQGLAEELSSHGLPVPVSLDDIL